MNKKNKLLCIFPMLLISTLISAQIAADFNWIKDVDGNKYSVYSYQGYSYMTENLKVKRFANGDSIIESKNAEEWKINCSKSLPTYMIHKDYPELGIMYNGFAVFDSRNLLTNGYTIMADSIYYEEYWENKYKGNEENRKKFELTLLGQSYTTSSAYNSDCRESKAFYIEPDGKIQESPCKGGRWWMIESGNAHIDNSFSTACCTGFDGAHHGDYEKDNWQSWGFYVRGIKKE